MSLDPSSLRAPKRLRARASQECRPAAIRLASKQRGAQPALPRHPLRLSRADGCVFTSWKG